MFEVGNGSAIHADRTVIANVNKRGASVSEKCAVAEKAKVVAILVHDKETLATGVCDRFAVQIYIDVFIAVRIPSVPPSADIVMSFMRQ